MVGLWIRPIGGAGARYERLCSAGPLKYYRVDLLAAAERAYSMLKRSKVIRAEREHDSGSVVSRRAAVLRQEEARRVNGSYGENMSVVSGRKIGNIRTLGQNTEQRQREREDEFCRQVIYRLEGDLIRYDSRQELLRMAGELEINQFRSSLLIAQIVESVRRHGVFEPTTEERKLYQKKQRKTNSKLKWLIGGLILTVAALVDLLAIKLLGS